MTAPPQDSSGPDLADHWLDSLATGQGKKVRHPALSLLHETFGQPVALAVAGWRFAKSTPGQLTLLTLIVSVMCVTTGLTVSYVVDQRQQQIEQLSTNTEPLAYQAHVIYTALSDADTAAATGFVQTAAGELTSRNAYEQAVFQAASAASETLARLGAAAGGAENPNQTVLAEPATALVVKIQQELSVYTGIVETARANQRAGNPVGSAYLAEASAFLRGTMLADAAALYDLTRHNTEQVQQRIGSLLLWPFLAVLSTLALLVWVQLRLARATNRRLNKGFLAATFLMLVLLSWLTTSNTLTYFAGKTGFEQATTPLAELTAVRIGAQQQRTDETLALIQRQAATGQQDFAEAVGRISRALDLAAAMPGADVTTITQARAALAGWQKAHAQVQDARANGAYDEATALILGDGAAATAYQALDQSLTQLIESARDNLQDYIHSGLIATWQLASFSLGISILAALCCGLGIRPRLQEYL